MSDNTQANNGIGCFTVLLMIFITLKLTDNIDWSWWWILAPFWIPVALVIIILGFVLVSKTYGFHENHGRVKALPDSPTERT